MTMRTQMYQISALLGLSACVSSNVAAPLITETRQVADFEDGTAVRVRGYLVFDDHARQLWPSEERISTDNLEDCFTLINTLPHQQILEEKNRSMVTIVGRAFRDVLTGRVDFGACGRTGVLVHAVE